MPVNDFSMFLCKFGTRSLQSTSTLSLENYFRQLQTFVKEKVLISNAGLIPSELEPFA